MINHMLPKTTKGKKSLGVLFLSDVFVKNCQMMEDLFHDRLVSSHETDQRHLKKYDKIPALFTSWETYPKQTNLKCWICGRLFKEQPWFEPQSIEPISRGPTGRIILASDTCDNDKHFSVVPRGNFCSKNCVRYHINRSDDDIAVKHDKVAMLKFVAQMRSGSPVLDIQPCINPVEMIQYGGNMTEAEWVACTTELDTNYKAEVKNRPSISSMLQKLGDSAF